MTPGFYGDFPKKLGLYYSSPGKDFLSQNFYLASVDAGEAERRALHAVTFHKGPGLLQTTVYASPEHGTTPMAVAKNDRRYSSAVTLTLPPSKGNNNSRTEPMKHGFTSNTHTFSINGEDFQWTDSGTAKPKVRRLVKLAGRSSKKSSVSSDGARKRIFTSRVASTDIRLEDPLLRDEVLVTWTEGRLPNRSGQLAILEFHESSFGSSASMELQEYLKLFAVCSVLAICQQGAAIECKSHPMRSRSRSRLTFADHG